MSKAEKKVNKKTCTVNSNICFVSVVNNFEIFNKSIKNNTMMNLYEQIVFDNTCMDIQIILSGKIKDHNFSSCNVRSCIFMFKEKKSHY